MSNERNKAIQAMMQPKLSEDRWLPGVIQMRVYAELEAALWGIACLALKEGYDKALTYKYVSGWITDPELLDQFADDLEYEN